MSLLGLLRHLVEVERDRVVDPRQKIKAAATRAVVMPSAMPMRPGGPDR
jgi:hypothetical protein